MSIANLMNDILRLKKEAGIPDPPEAVATTLERGQPCPHCGWLAPMGKEYCIWCGKKLGAADICRPVAECPACGAWTPQGAYCAVCGVRLPSPDDLEYVSNEEFYGI